MFKRVTWMSIGMAVGATGAFRAKRRVEATLERYLPEQVADRASASARGMSQVVRAAALEGREAMRATEVELRSRVDARTFVGERDQGAREASVDAATRPAPGPRRLGRPARPDVARTGARRRSRR